MGKFRFRPCPGNNLIVFTITDYGAAAIADNDAIALHAGGEEEKIINGYRNYLNYRTQNLIDKGENFLRAATMSLSCITLIKWKK